MSNRTQRADGVATREQITHMLRSLRAEGKHPTARELATATGLSHTNVRHHVDWLLRDGVVAVQKVPSTSLRTEIVLLEDEGDGING